MAKSYKTKEGNYIDSNMIVNKNGNKYKKLGDYLTDTGWVNMNCNSNYGSDGNQNPPQYRKIGNRVYLRGLLYLLSQSVPANTKFATLPPNCRPKCPTINPLYFSVFTRGSTTLGILNVYNDGSLYAPNVLTTQNYFCTLDGVSFLTD